MDGQSIAAFEERLEDNLYKVWNRMSAGVTSTAGAGGGDPQDRRQHQDARGADDRRSRRADRGREPDRARDGEVSTMRDSYGYRPGRGAHDALAVARKRCWDYDWVVEFDIRKFFDSVPHDLVVRAVEEASPSRPGCSFA